MASQPWQGIVARNLPPPDLTDPDTASPRRPRHHLLCPLMAPAAGESLGPPVARPAAPQPRAELLVFSLLLGARLYGSGGIGAPGAAQQLGEKVCGRQAQPGAGPSSPGEHIERDAERYGNQPVQDLAQGDPNCETYETNCPTVWATRSYLLLVVQRTTGGHPAQPQPANVLRGYVHLCWSATHWAVLAELTTPPDHPAEYQLRKSRSLTPGA